MTVVASKCKGQNLEENKGYALATFTSKLGHKGVTHRARHTPSTWSWPSPPPATWLLEECRLKQESHGPIRSRRTFFRAAAAAAAIKWSGGAM